MPRKFGCSTATSSPKFSVETYTSSSHDYQGYEKGNKLCKYLIASAVTIGSYTGNVGELNADHEGMCIVYNADGSCALYRTFPHDDEGNGSGSGGGGSTPPPKPTTTTIPWDRRDDDGDGNQNGSDACTQTSVGEQVDDKGCSANQRDDDGDGVISGVEIFLGADPKNPNTDSDSKPDGVELLNQDGTIKAILDTDADGLLDVVEPDTDADSDGLSPETGDENDSDSCVPNIQSPNCDSDGDGLTNQAESNLGTDPNNPDSDGDGVPDAVDAQNKALLVGETVDEFGIIIPAPTSTLLSSTTSSQVTLTTQQMPTSISSEVNGSGSDKESDTNKLIYVGGAILVAMGGLVLRKKRIF